MPERRPGTTSQRTALYEEATRLVEEEYARDLTLAEVAHRIATSKRQLQRVYNEIGETSFRDQLTAVRMERAAAMLQQNGHTVRDVANSVGYRQAAQFAKAFRAHHGLSPSEYRGRLGERHHGLAAA